MIGWAVVLGGAQVVLDFADRSEVRVRQDVTPVVDVDTTPTATLRRSDRRSTMSLSHFFRVSQRGLVGSPTGNDLYQGLGLNLTYTVTRRLSLGLTGGGFYGITDFTSLAAPTVTASRSPTDPGPPPPTSPLLNRVPRGPLQVLGGSIGGGFGYTVSRADSLNGYFGLASSTGLGDNGFAFPSQTVWTGSLGYRIALNRNVGLGPQTTATWARTEGGIFTEIYTVGMGGAWRMSRRDSIGATVGVAITRSNASGVAPTTSPDQLLPVAVAGPTRTRPSPALAFNYTRLLPGRASIGVNAGYSAFVDRLTGDMDQRLTFDAIFEQRFGTRWTGTTSLGFARSLGGSRRSAPALTSYFGSVVAAYNARRWLTFDAGVRWFGSDVIDPLLAGFVGMSIRAPSTRW